MLAQPPSAAASARRPGLRARSSFELSECGGDRQDLGTLELGTHVLCRGSQGGPHVGTVVGHRTAASGERYLLCRWYYRPEESADGRRPFDGCSELLESDHVDIVPRSAVLSRCRVLTAGEFARERDGQIARIRSAREMEYFERNPAVNASRFAAEPWSKTFGNYPTHEELELLNVMHRLLRRVQSEVRPDECRRPLQNWLGTYRPAPECHELRAILTRQRMFSGPPIAAMDREEFPPPVNSKAAKSRATTL